MVNGQWSMIVAIALSKPPEEANNMLAKDKSNLQDFDAKTPTKDSSKAPVLIPPSKKRKRYAIEYQNKRIGIIKPGIDCWIAVANLQYGAAESKLDSPMLAVYWLVDNYKRVELAGIRFKASQNLMHYNIETEDWLIKIDKTPDDCLAKINHKNNLDFEYFPDLNSAVVFSFDLILNQDRSNSNNYNSEF